MPSTAKPAGAKRTGFPRAAACTKAFVKDWEKLARTGRYDMRQLKEAMLLLIANDGPTHCFALVSGRTFRLPGGGIGVRGGRVHAFVMQYIGANAPPPQCLQVPLPPSR